MLNCGVNTRMELSSEAEPFIYWAKGTYPLHFACVTGNELTARIFTRVCQSAEKLNERFQIPDGTLSHIQAISASLGKEDQISALQSFSGSTSLELALLRSTDKILKILLDTPLIEADKVSPIGLTPFLMYVLNVPNELLTKTMIDSGRIDLDFSSQNELCCTAAHFAAFTGKVYTLNLLNKAGAEINKPNAKGETPLYVAVKSQKIGAAVALLEMERLDLKKEDSAFSSIAEIVRLGNLTLLEALLEKDPKALVPVYQEEDSQVIEYSLMEYAFIVDQPVVVKYFQEKGETITVEQQVDVISNPELYPRLTEYLCK